MEFELIRIPVLALYCKTISSIAWQTGRPWEKEECNRSDRM